MRRVWVFSAVVPVVLFFFFADKCVGKFCDDGPKRSETFGSWVDDGEWLDLLTFGHERWSDALDAADRYYISRRCVKQEYRRVYSIGERAFDCEFYFRAYLPSNDCPMWMRRIVMTLISVELANFFTDEELYSEAFDIYTGRSEGSPKLRRIDLTSVDLRQIAEHYAAEYERLYREEYDCPDEKGDVLGPRYDFCLIVRPVWESSDKRFSTYCFHRYGYMGGPHGGEAVFYLTFDNVSGRLFGVDDLLKAGTFAKAVVSLEKRVSDYGGRRSGFEGVYPAFLDPDHGVRATFDTVLKETVEGRIYPRPALTGRGVVFSYQPYELGTPAVGVVHFIVPDGEIETTR